MVPVNATKGDTECLPKARAEMFTATLCVIVENFNLVTCL